MPSGLQEQDGEVLCGTVGSVGRWWLMRRRGVGALAVVMLAALVWGGVAQGAGESAGRGAYAGAASAAEDAGGREAGD